MEQFKKDRFAFHEIFLNSSGKTSGSAFIGVLLGVVASISWMAVIFGWFFGFDGALEIMKEILLLATISGGLMGTRKLSGAMVGRKEAANGSDTSVSENMC